MTRAWRIRSSLAVLVAVCITPGVLLSGYFIVSDYRAHKAQAISQAIATARAAAANLDRDLASIESGLRVLSASHDLQKEDLEAFYEEAKRALPYQNITNYVLIDAHNRQRLNTLLPYENTLKVSGSPNALQQVFVDGKRVITDVFIGPVAKRPILAMGVPVQLLGQTVYSLNAGIFPGRVSEVLQNQRLPKEWISAVLDSKGNIVARTHEMDRFVGKPAVPDLVRITHDQREGVLETTTLEGVPVITAFSHSQVCDWSVAVGIPKADLTGGLWRSVILLLCTGIVLYVLALAFAWRMGMRHVVQPAQHLLRRMQGMSEGEDPGPNHNVYASEEFVMLENGFAEMGEGLKQREKEREAKLAAEAANRAKTEFISRMSHELRTPLNAVMGFAQVLKMDPFEPLSARQSEMLDKINASGRHLVDMVSDVMDVSRIETGALNVMLTDLDVPTLIQECAQIVKLEAQQQQIALRIETASPLPRIQADAVRLKQVLINLLSNAIKYNRPQGQVTLRTQLLDHAVRFEVIDTGLGMSALQMQRLYQPFNRLGRENSPTPGTGMGLVISKRLLVLMGSDLQVASEVNQGSRFWFDIPLTDDQTPQ